MRSKRNSAYQIGIHQHRFAAWAASRAASVKGCRFSVEKGRTVLEACGFNAAFSSPAKLPAAVKTDAQHRRWRAKAIRAAGSLGLSFTHGVAAKLINIYLKCRFVCGGHYKHPRVCRLHPPIDDVLLRRLARLDIGGFASHWRHARGKRWSKFSQQDYESVIELMRRCSKRKPLWMIEEHWAGNQ